MLTTTPVAVPRLIWNATSSAPLGLYLRTDRYVETGDFALIRTPPSVRALAAKRGYLPADVPMVKRVIAGAGDVVCARGDIIAISGRVVVRRARTDHEGRSLPTWSGCERLSRDQVFPLMRDVPDSFDGRYFGPVSRQLILGRLIPLWTE